jgi:hypothetical protein
MKSACQVKVENTFATPSNSLNILLSQQYRPRLERVGGTRAKVMGMVTTC